MPRKAHNPRYIFVGQAALSPSEIGPDCNRIRICLAQGDELRIHSPSSNSNKMTKLRLVGVPYYLVL